ncbi:hypothetical protein RBWH47_01503 [Rhodopirellula baltica WH47]|uniref:Uncharacterized protein n=1 Tax=Rhodopirellula baltica WH47 TaxID=991778 RepID=F2AKT9_RHOBT|nr:hypothetical protein RBWH47_01503 [Rhodopirellula baltica WH47]
MLFRATTGLDCSEHSFDAVRWGRKHQEGVPRETKISHGGDSITSLSIEVV